MKSDVTDQLEEAIAKGNLDLVEKLVREGADVNATTSDGLSMLTHALDATNVSIAEFLARNGASFVVPDAPYTPLEAAIEAPAYDLIFEMVRARVDVNQKGTEETNYPLHRLAWGYLEPEFFKLFKWAGADPNLANADGETPYQLMERNLSDCPQHSAAINEILDILAPEKPEVRPEISVKSTEPTGSLATNGSKPRCEPHQQRKQPWWTRFKRVFFRAGEPADDGVALTDNTAPHPGPHQKETMQMPVEVIGVHSVASREPCHLVELLVFDVQSELPMAEFTQPQSGKPKSSWQVPYEDKFLNPEGTAVIGDVLLDSYDHPELWSGDVRLAFFFHYLKLNEPLQTPFGPVKIPAPTPRPARLSIMKYEPVG